jgi:hypothetical protein
MWICRRRLAGESRSSSGGLLSGLRKLFDSAHYPVKVLSFEDPDGTALNLRLHRKMNTAIHLALFLFLAQMVSAQALSAFDPHLEVPLGGDVSVQFFVARTSHLYFAGCGSHQCAVVQTDRKGDIETTLPLGVERPTAFDVDEEGNLYVLSSDSFLTIFLPTGVIGRTVHIEPKAVTVALSEGVPMIAYDNNQLRLMDSGSPSFNLSSWPRPWKILAHRRNQFMIWRPEESTLIALHASDEDRSMEQRSVQGARTAAGDSDGHVFILMTEAPGGETEIREYDDHLTSNWISHYPLPDAFRPDLLAVHDHQIYLADEKGKVAIYPLLRTVPTDGRAELISDLATVRDAAHAAGYHGKVEIKLVVGTDGVPQSITIQNPERLANHPDVLAAIQSLRFRSKVRDGIAVSSPVQIEVN